MKISFLYINNIYITHALALMEDKASCFSVGPENAILILHETTQMFQVLAHRGFYKGFRGDFKESLPFENF